MNLNRNFDVLEISSDATFEDAKAAYRLMVQVWHPDKHAHNEKLQAKATSKIKEINRAWLEVEAHFLNGGAGTHETECKKNEKHDSAQQTGQVFQIYIVQESGLMWATNGNIAGKQMNWFDATSWVTGLNYGEYTDWRLPQSGDFDSISRNYTILNTHGFNNVQAGIYWTASSLKDDNNFATFIDMRSGNSMTTVKTHECYVLPVRGGHIKDDETIEAETREAERQNIDSLRQAEEERCSINVSFSSIKNGRVRCPICNSMQVLDNDIILYTNIFKCTKCKSEVGLVHYANETINPNEANTQASVLFRPLEQQSVAEKMFRAIIVATVFGFFLRGCT